MISPFSCNGLLAGRLPCLHHIVERPEWNSTNRPRKFFFFRALELRIPPGHLNVSASASDESFFISTAESALAGIAALVPVGSAPELSHKRTEPQRSCRACGTYLRGLNAPNSNSPIRLVPTPRRSASDQPLDHRTLLWPRHDLAVQLAKAEFAAIDRNAKQSAASRSPAPIPPAHERPQSQPAVCRHRSGPTSGLSPAMPTLRRSAL